MSAHLEALTPILPTIVEHAVRVDREGSFPAASIGALREAGLLGLDAGPRAAAEVVERVAAACGSTAMVLTMHYAGAAVIRKLGPAAVREAIASGEHLSTLAFSEAGSRSQFWVPVSTARRGAETGTVVLDAKKSFVTSARHATAYVWSSKPLRAEGLSTIWLVPADAPGLDRSAGFDGLGLRGNDSGPVSANGVVVPEANRLGEDGKGFDVMMGVVLPLFNVLSAACSIGLMEAAVSRTVAHATATRHEHQGTALRELPTIRAYLARMRTQADMARALLYDTVLALESSRPDAMLRVLEAKAAAGEAAIAVVELAMRVCGGAAFARGAGVDRVFRDAHASTVMTPTTDVLYDFIGKAVTGMDLL